MKKDIKLSDRTYALLLDLHSQDEGADELIYKLALFYLSVRKNVSDLKP